MKDNKEEKLSILAICGSKRENGNTHRLLTQCLEPFTREGHITEIISPGKMDIESCRGCEGCSKTNRCVIKDEMQELYDKIRGADALIVGSPTYFYNMSSDMKKIIDRCYCFLSFDSRDRSVWISELNQRGERLMGLITVCEQNNEKDLGYTAAAMEDAWSSLGFRPVFNQKVLHAFKAGELTVDVLQEARTQGQRLLKTLKLTEESL